MLHRIPGAFFRNLQILVIELLIVMLWVSLPHLHVYLPFLFPHLQACILSNFVGSHYLICLVIPLVDNRS